MKAKGLLAKDLKKILSEIPDEAVIIVATEYAGHQCEFCITKTKEGFRKGKYGSKIPTLTISGENLCVK